MTSALDEMAKGFALTIPALDDEDRINTQDIETNLKASGESKLKTESEDTKAKHQS